MHLHRCVLFIFNDVEEIDTHMCVMESKPRDVNIESFLLINCALCVYFLKILYKVAPGCVERSEFLYQFTFLFFFLFTLQIYTVTSFR